MISVASNKFSDAAGNQNTDGADANNTLSLPTNTTPAQTSGELQPQSDSGTKGDNKTLDNTPAYGGTAPAGSQVEVVINGKTYTTVADSNGQYSVVVPDALPDGTYVPKIIVTPAGSNTPNAPQDGTPFTIDTTPPTVVVSSDKSTLGVGQTATITFTLNEASSDFTLADVQVSGGTLSNFQGSGTSYTATFTPNAGSIDPSVVHVASNKFADAAGNVNTDGAQSNNTVSMATNTMPADTTAPTIVVARTNAAANQGTSNELLKTISGTGNPGDTVYLVENTDTNVVGTATVGVNGQWSVTLTGTRPGGANSYAAYQLDPHGNTSALSNIWQFNQNLPVDDGFDGSFGTTNSWDTVVAGMVCSSSEDDPAGLLLSVCRSAEQRIDPLHISRRVSCNLPDVLPTPNV